MGIEKEAEIYSSKLERYVTSKSARLVVTISAVRGNVEDINEAMNKLVQTLRDFDASGFESTVQS